MKFGKQLTVTLQHLISKTVHKRAEVVKYAKWTEEKLVLVQIGKLGSFWPTIFQKNCTVHGSSNHEFRI